MKNVPDMKEQIFTDLIAPHIVPKQTRAEIAAEFYKLQHEYGNLVTITRYAAAKRLAKSTVAAALQAFPENEKGQDQ